MWVCSVLQYQLVLEQAKLKLAAERELVKKLKAAPAVPVPKQSRTVKKTESTRTYERHVEELCVFLRAFDVTDVAPLVVSAARCVSSARS